MPLSVKKQKEILDAMIDMAESNYSLTEIVNHMAESGAFGKHFAVVYEEYHRTTDFGEALTVAGIFSPEVVSIIKSTYATNLLNSFYRAKEYIDMVEFSRRQLKKSLVYPSALVVFANVMFYIITFFLVPRFYNSLFQPLHLKPGVVLSFYLFWKNHWYLAVSVNAAVYAGLYFALKTGLLHRIGRMIPGIKKFLYLHETSVFFSILSVIYNTTYEIKRALIDACLYTSPRTREMIPLVENYEQHQDAVFEEFVASGIWTEVQRDSVLTGLKTGQLPDVLARLAKRERIKYEEFMETFPTVMEVLSLVFVVSTVALMIASVYLEVVMTGSKIIHAVR